MKTYLLYDSLVLQTSELKYKLAFIWTAKGRNYIFLLITDNIYSFANSKCVV